jgi:cytochrome c553
MLRLRPRSATAPAADRPREAARRRIRGWLLALAAAGLALPAAGGDIALGKEKAQACASCHGALGVSVLPNAPHLAGQPEIYLVEQLRLYRSGRRPHEVMGVVARTLSDRDIDDLAAWYAAIPFEVRPPK